MITQTRRTLDTVAVPIAGGREFTAALYRAPDGEPEDLVLSVGYAADHNGWKNHAGTICIPAGALPALRAALQALEAV